MTAPTRRRWSAAVKRSILERQDYICALCSKPLTGAVAVEYDHEIALGIGGADDPDNIVATHAHCHKAKTAGDKKKIAKVKHQAGKVGQRNDRRLGKTRKIPSRPFAGSRKFNGDVRWN